MAGCELGCPGRARWLVGLGLLFLARGSSGQSSGATVTCGAPVLPTELVSSACQRVHCALGTWAPSIFHRGLVVQLVTAVAYQVHNALVKFMLSTATSCMYTLSCRTGAGGVGPGHPTGARGHFGVLRKLCVLDTRVLHDQSFDGGRAPPRSRRAIQRVRPCPPECELSAIACPSNTLVLSPNHCSWQ